MGGRRVPEADWGKKILGGYFDQEKHLYRNERGTIVPSTTQVFSILGLSDFSAVNPDDLEWKRGYGDAVHLATNFLVSGDLDWDTLDDAIIPAVTGIEYRLREMRFELEASEEPMVASICGMEYGLTSDLRGTVEHRGKRRHAIIDLKTGAKFSKTWDWQLGGYVWPRPKVPLGWLGIVLQVSKAGVMKPHYVENVEQAKRDFHILLAAAILKINHGFVKMQTAR